MRSAIPGLSGARYKLWLLTADYVFKSALAEQQASSGLARRRQRSDCHDRSPSRRGGEVGHTRCHPSASPGPRPRRLASNLGAEATSRGAAGESCGREGWGHHWDAGESSSSPAPLLLLPCCFGGRSPREGTEGTSLCQQHPWCHPRSGCRRRVRFPKFRRRLSPVPSPLNGISMETRSPAPAALQSEGTLLGILFFADDK